MRIFPWELMRISPVSSWSTCENLNRDDPNSPVIFGTVGGSSEKPTNDLDLAEDGFG